MATDSPLDYYIKSNLIADMFNLIGIRNFERKKESVSTRMQSTSKSRHSPIRKSTGLANITRSTSPPVQRRENPLSSIKYKDFLKETLEEQDRRGHFIRIYPAKGTYVYDQYFMGSRPYNKFLYTELYVDLMKESAPTILHMHQSLSSRPITCNSISDSPLKYKGVACPPLSPQKNIRQRPPVRALSIESPSKTTLPELPYSETRSDMIEQLTTASSVSTG